MLDPAVRRPVDRTGGRLDAAVLAYREEPSEENRLELLAAQGMQCDRFFASQAASYAARCAGDEVAGSGT
ncbi:MAG: hypothetical protein ACYCTE_16155 [Acidimicrobiales bacterium]